MSAPAHHAGPATWHFVFAGRSRRDGRPARHRVTTRGTYKIARVDALQHATARLGSPRLVASLPLFDL